MCLVAGTTCLPTPAFRRLFSAVLLVGAFNSFAARCAPADEPAAAAPAAESFTLRYQFAAGQTLRWKVVHLGTTETTIRGATQTSKSRSVSTKAWRVTEVDDQGTATLSHVVEAVEMWQQLSDRPEVRYNSETDQTIPSEYQQVAQTVGVPLATIKVATDGTITSREGESNQPNLGLGEMVMLLPPKPVKIGGTWYEPSELPVRLADGRVQRIKIRKLYRLESVRTGVATIAVKTEVLTPATDPRVRSQLVQQLTNGTLKFDLDAGRIISRQVDWDELVVGFNGSDSSMKYLARFTEELLPDAPKTARVPGPGR